MWCEQYFANDEVKQQLMELAKERESQTVPFSGQATA